LKPQEDRIYVTGVRDRFRGYPSKGLTPVKLGSILKEADAGDIYRQYELFEEMEEKDTHLFSILQTRKLAVSNKNWEIIAASDSERDKEIADFVRENFENLSMEDIFLDLLDAIGKGFSICEIMWDTSSLPYRIKSIDWCHQKNFIPNWSDDGSKRFEGFRYVTEDDPGGIELPERKFIIHVYKAKSGYPERAGVVRICSWMYLFKNYDIKDWIAFAEIFGMPFRIGKYEVGATEDEKKVLLDAVANLGSDAAAIIPSSTLIEFIEAIRGSSTDVYESLGNFCNKEMSKAVLGQTLTTDIGEHGSYAAEQGHEQVRQDIIEADGKAVQKTVKKQAIVPLVDVNYGPQKRYPTLKIHVELPKDLKEEAGTYKILVDMGMKIPAKHTHEKFGIPQAKDGEEIIEKPAGPGMGFKKPTFAKMIPMKNRYTKLNNEIKAKVSDAVPHYSKRIAAMKDVIEKTRGLKELSDRLRTIPPDWKFINGMAEVLRKGLYKSWNIAAYQVNRKYHLKHYMIPLQKMDIDWDLQSQEAINFFRLQAFTIGHIEDAQLLEGIRAGALKALEEGISYGEFRKDINSLFDSMGVSRMDPHHLETAFVNNMQSSYMAGKFHQLRLLGNFFPYWQYITMDDGKVRDSHLAMHGRVYHKDDPIWKTWYPPNGHHCRCDVEALDVDDLKEQGINVFDSTTHPAIYVPDKGWQRNIALSTTQFEKWIGKKEESGISLDQKPADYGWKALKGVKDPGFFEGNFKAFMEDLLDDSNRLNTFEGKVLLTNEVYEKLLARTDKHPFAFKFKDALLDPMEVWGSIEGDSYKIRLLKRFDGDKGIVVVMKYERNVLQDMELLTFVGSSDMKYFEKQRSGIAIFKK